MRKLKLDVESLVVQTFETAEDAGSRGTVKAHDSLATTGGRYYCDALCDATYEGETCGPGDSCMAGYC